MVRAVSSAVRLCVLTACVLIGYGVATLLAPTLAGVLAVVAVVLIVGPAIAHNVGRERNRSRVRRGTVRT